MSHEMWNEARYLAETTDLTIGEIADRVQWPELKSIQSLQRYLEAHVPGRKTRGIETWHHVAKRRAVGA